MQLSMGSSVPIGPRLSGEHKGKYTHLVYMSSTPGRKAEWDRVATYKDSRISILVDGGLISLQCSAGIN